MIRLRHEHGLTHEERSTWKDWHIRPYKRCYRILKLDIKELVIKLKCSFSINENVLSMLLKRVAVQGIVTRFLNTTRILAICVYRVNDLGLSNQAHHTASPEMYPSRILLLVRILLNTDINFSIIKLLEPHTLSYSCGMLQRTPLKSKFSLN